MGVDYDVRLAVGFEVSSAELRRCFSSDLEGMYMFDGEDYDDLHFLLDDLTCQEYVDCVYYTEGNMMEHPDNVSYIIGPQLDTVGANQQGRVSVGGAVHYPDILGLGEEIDRIGRRLRAFGLRISEKAVVKAVLTVT